MEKVVKSIQSKIFKVDEMKKIVYGKALVPDKEDSQGDIVTKEDIEAAAHNFMMNMQKSLEISATQALTDQPVSAVGLQHQVFKDIGYFVESYVDEEGSWVLATKVVNEEVWDKILKGEITGYSIGGTGTRIPLE